MNPLSFFRLANAVCGGRVGNGQRNIAQCIRAAHWGNGHLSIQQGGTWFQVNLHSR